MTDRPPAAPPLVLVAGVSDLDGSTMLRDLYSNAVLRSGGLPVVVSPTVHAAGRLDALLDRMDAVLVPGGRDLDTARLGLGPVHPAARPGPAEQQDADVALVRATLDRDLPLLGICYGMQLLGIVGGGALHQHLPDDLPQADAHFAEIHAGLVEHDVRLAPGSRVAAAFAGSEGGSLVVKSGHHQAVAQVAEGWRVTAVADDGVVEAIESSSHRFAVGVQWHPERAEPAGAQDGIVAALVAAAVAR